MKTSRHRKAAVDAVAHIIAVQHRNRRNQKTEETSSLLKVMAKRDALKAQIENKKKTK